MITVPALCILIFSLHFLSLRLPSFNPYKLWTYIFFGSSYLFPLVLLGWYGLVTKQVRTYLLRLWLCSISLSVTPCMWLFMFIFNRQWITIDACTKRGPYVCVCACSRRNVGKIELTKPWFHRHLEQHSKELNNKH